MKPLRKILNCDNERGAALIISYLVLAVLFTLTAGFAVSTVAELKLANQYRDATAAFWRAEAGVHKFIQNTDLLNSGDITYYYSAATDKNFLHLSKDDSNPAQRLVTAIGNTNGVSRSLQLEFPAQPPGLFDYTFSSGGDLTLTAFFAGIDVDAKTRLGGNYNQHGIAVGMFDDKVTAVSPSDSLQLAYPDADGNSTPDEFTDFVQYNQDTLSTYDPNDVIYIQRQESDPPLEVWPDGTVDGESVVGKKVIYVEGPTSGSGDVDVYFGSSWASDQNLTVISTGSVNYYQPLQNVSNGSRLNTISWDDYTEGAILYSAHAGTTYTHGAANFGSIASISYTQGNLIANDQISFILGGVWKMFDYASPYDEDGLVPPGFEGLIAGGISGYSSTPSQWAEL